MKSNMNLMLFAVCFFGLIIALNATPVTTVEGDTPEKRPSDVPITLARSLSNMVLTDEGSPSENIQIPECEKNYFAPKSSFDTLSEETGDSFDTLSEETGEDNSEKTPSIDLSCLSTSTPSITTNIELIATPVPDEDDTLEEKPMEKSFKKSVSCVGGLEHCLVKSISDFQTKINELLEDLLRNKKNCPSVILSIQEKNTEAASNARHLIIRGSVDEARENLINATKMYFHPFKGLVVDKKINDIVNSFISSVKNENDIFSPIQ